MEDTRRRIQLLQEQRELRRKYYEEEERRIQEEYQLELIKIGEEFDKATKEIELEFAVKRNGIKKQFGDNKVGIGSKPELQPVIDADISPSVCTTSPIKAINQQLPSQPRNHSLSGQWLDAGNVSCGTARGAGSRGDIMCAGLWRHVSAILIECKTNCIKEIACNLGCNNIDNICNQCNGLNRCEVRSSMMMPTATGFVIYDPGGKNVNNSFKYYQLQICVPSPSQFRIEFIFD